ncbi:hypothetical protein DFH07DRAFT_951611 [Mycena maculata]|uniref:Uncharacterized protein n=1 Tax=Mycena maculata TaxID=230809 RepID=A0AAD7NVA7_9AGAR|nr:hypothetical protein DFH07DRAFT_951611 [Mycena maculata]
MMIARHRYPIHTVIPPSTSPRGYKSCAPLLFAPSNWKSTNRNGAPRPVWTVEFRSCSAIFIDGVSKDEAMICDRDAVVKFHDSVINATNYLARRCEDTHFPCQLRQAEIKYGIVSVPEVLVYHTVELLTVRGDLQAFYALTAMPGGLGLYLIVSGGFITQKKNSALRSFSKCGGELKAALTIDHAVQLALSLKTFEGRCMDEVLYVLENGHICGLANATHTKEEVQELQPMTGCNVYVCATKPVALAVAAKLSAKEDVS